jgi:hypothetical protein
VDVAEQLTIVCAVYGQPMMLAEILKRLSAYPADLRKQLRLILVDDHGDPPISVAQAQAFNGQVETEVYRIEDDIAWNQMGARNLGMHRARGWCAMVDPDMVLTELALRRILKFIERNPRGHVMRYGLRHLDRLDEDSIMSSPNTYVIHRDDFMAVGGYDEDYAGHKGWSDVQLLDILKAHYKVVERPNVWALFYHDSDVPDARVATSSGVDRDISRNKKLRVDKRKEAQTCGGWKRWVKEKKGRNLRFQWRKTYLKT